MTASNGFPFYDPTYDGAAWTMDATTKAITPRVDLSYPIGDITHRPLTPGGGMLDGTLFTISAGTELVSFTTRASLFAGATITGAGTAGTIPAAALNQIGRFISWDLYGYIGNTGTPNYTVDVALGSTVLWTTASFASVAITGSGLFRLQGNAVVKTTGATGTVWANGSFTYHQTVLLATGISTANAAVVTYDLTAALAFTANATCGTSSSSNKIALTNGIVRIGG